jgi:signal transduction histidine kinase
LNRNTIRLLILLGTLSITGIIAVQAYWVKRAFDLKEQQFRQTVMISLRNVANKISSLYKLSSIENPVSQLSSDYYVANLRIPLDADVLEHYLKEEFKKQNLLTDFGYSMFVILKQKRLSEVQRDFINNMTHEFQTPISTIRVATDVLSQAKIMDQPERLKKYVHIIRQENNRLKNQVESVLNTARMERGKMQLDVQLQELHSIIYDVTEGVKAELEDSLSIELNATRTSIYADRIQLISLIRNLLENAIKYSGKKPCISIRTENADDTLVLSISDKGIGIPKEHQSKIFNKFYRVPTGNTHNVKGFGLGLSYVREIVRAHKWDIKVDSEPGKGSTFTIIMKQEV